MNTDVFYISFILLLLVACIFLYIFFTYKYNGMPTIYNRKKFWIKELLILFNDINKGTIIDKIKLELSPVLVNKKSFDKVAEYTENFLHEYEDITTEFICNHIRLILFKGEENMTEKDYAQIYAIVLILHMEHT